MNCLDKLLATLGFYRSNRYIVFNINLTDDRFQVIYDLVTRAPHLRQLPKKENKKIELLGG